VLPGCSVVKFQQNRPLQPKIPAQAPFALQGQQPLEPRVGASSYNGGGASSSFGTYMLTPEGMTAVAPEMPAPPTTSTSAERMFPGAKYAIRSPYGRTYPLVGPVLGQPVGFRLLTSDEVPTQLLMAQPRLLPSSYMSIRSDTFEPSSEVYDHDSYGGDDDDDEYEYAVDRMEQEQGIEVLEADEMPSLSIVDASSDTAASSDEDTEARAMHQAELWQPALEVVTISTELDDADATDEDDDECIIPRRR